MHGNEKVGLLLKRRLGYLDIPVFIGNPKALRKNIRFVEEDLNRVFPGDSGGCYEERRAIKLLAKIKDFDIVIDIHSSSNECPLFGIITSPNKEKVLMAKKMGLDKLIVMPEELAKGKSLIDNVKCGISLEIGPHKAKKNVRELGRAIKSLIDDTSEDQHEMKICEVFDIIHKNIDDEGKIENFRQVRKSQPLLKNRELLAEEDFVPILVEEEAYENILCLAARETLENSLNN